MTPDQPISLAVCVLGCVLSLVLPRRWAFSPLALIMCAYPSLLLIPPKQLSLSPARVVGLVLLMRCLLSEEIRSRFKWKLVDTMAAVYFLLLTIGLLINLKPDVAINNRAGFFLSAMVPFWCIRFLVTDKEAFYNIIKTWLWAALPLAFLGLYQMKTGVSPYFQIMQYQPLWEKIVATIRHKRAFMGEMHYRAFAPFMQFIMFGWFFAILFAPATTLFWQKRSLFPWVIPWVCLPLGVISSISSGPMMLSALSFGIVAMFPLRAYWKQFAALGFVAWLIPTLFSNRSLMEIIASFGSDPLSSYYRVALERFFMREGGMGGRWFAGWGDIPLTPFNDLCIHWIWLLVVHGVIGLVGFYGFMASAGWHLWKGKEKAQTMEDQWLMWSLMATLLASIGGMLIVTLFSEMYFIYHAFLGIVANADLMVGGGGGGKGAGRMRIVDVLTERNGEKVILRYHLKPGQKLALVQPTGEVNEEAATVPK